MNQRLNIAGLVLAGGKSSRMGQDKALLELNNESLLTRNSRILSQAGCLDVFISGDNQGSRQQQNAIADQVDDLGPVGGILTVLQHLLAHDYQWLVIVAVDMPHLCPQLLQPLFNQLNRGNGRYFADSLFPMIIKIDHAVVCTINQQLSTNDKRSRSVYRLINNLALDQITTDQTQADNFINVNTPEQWQDCLLGQAPTHHNRG